MAKSTKKEVKIHELIARSEAARLQLGKSHAELKRRLDVPTRLRESVKADPKKWIGGSAAVGLVGSFLFRSKKKRKRNRNRVGGLVKEEKNQRNMLFSALGLIFTVMRPVAKIYGTKLLKDFLKGQLTRGSVLRPKRKVLPR